MEQKIPDNVRRILMRLESAGAEAWCVGGAVRDLLLGGEPVDWDVTTDALPEEVMRLFAPDAVPTGLQHGTVTVGGGRGVEITTFRRDGTYRDHRRPDTVTFGTSLTEDLSRRDFTVNAVALNLRGRLCDPYGGVQDLKKGILRAVGQPELRFQEDALRIMRGLRFASKLGFAVEENTAAAMERCAPLLGEIAPERLKIEMEGLLCGSHAGDVLLRWPHVLGVFLPELLPAVGFDQQTPYHIFDVWEHTARAVDAAPAEPVLRWVMLFHDLGKPSCFTVGPDGRGHFYGHHRESACIADVCMERLRFDNRSRDIIKTLVDIHDSVWEDTVPTVRRRLNKYGEPLLRQLLSVKRADCMAQAPRYRDRLVLIDRWETVLDQVLDSEDCFTLADLAVRGGDLLALGLQGPAVGQALHRLLEQVMDGTLPNNREILLTYAKETLV